MPVTPSSTSTSTRRQFSAPATAFQRYAWLIARNVLGWVLILGAIPVGITLPIPLGLPLFLIGFAMVSLPGKRRLTSRVLSGRPLRLADFRYRIAEIAGAIIVGVLALMVLRRRHEPGLVGRFALVTGAVLVGWLIVWAGLHAANLLLSFVPGMRRRMRPWLRRYGITVLPARREARLRPGRARKRFADNEEILAVDQEQKEKALTLWARSRKWVKTLAGFLITVAIFVWMLMPVVKKWHQVESRIVETSIGSFALSACMFATFLFVFRVLSWRTILAIWQRPLPLAPASRIWSTSELARYLPGVIWQVVGRVYLVKPYGVSAAMCSTSQVLELTIFLLANLIVALACVPWYVGQLSHQVQVYFYFAWPLAFLLLGLMHPRILYGLLDAILRKMGKPAVTLRMTGRQLLGLLAWAILGLLWQGVAIWVLLGQRHALDLSLPRIGLLLLGTYSLAWCAGFLAFWASAGIGPREVVMRAALTYALPPSVVGQFSDPVAFEGFLTFLVILLRLWTIAGELILSSIAYISDYRGAIGKADAPGRVMAASPA